MNRHIFICAPCRYVSKARNGGNCPRCGATLRHMGWRWRPPRKNNDRAWRDIERGAILWDERALARSARLWPYWPLAHRKAIPERLRVRNRTKRGGRR